MSTLSQQTSSPLPLKAFSEKAHYDASDIFVDKNDQYAETHNGLRRYSGFTAISSIPPSLPPDDIPNVTRRHRPPFRSPSSVRALQLSSPLASPRPKPKQTRRKGSYGLPRLSLDSFQNDSGIEEIEEENLVYEVQDAKRHARARKHQERSRGSRTVSGMTSGFSSPQTQPPLILLHVSVLPSPTPFYTHEVLERHAPPYVIQNYYLLREKLSEVITTRGVLVSHPGEEYDVLEERLLETLELCPPRVTGCGHFLDKSDGYSDNGQSVRTTVTLTPDMIEQTEPRAICDFANVSPSESHARDDTCETCSRSMRLHGVGVGDRRWNVNFYAANGLMRAGAWMAAWREMERVDVEITPWMSDGVKRALDDAMLKGEESASLEERQRELEVEMLRIDVKSAMERIEELERSLSVARDELELAHLESLKAQESTPPATVPKPAEEAGTANLTTYEAFRIEAPPEFLEDIPLSRLVQNYVLVLAQDRRNIALAVLSLLVMILSFVMGVSSQSNPPSYMVHSNWEAVHSRNTVPMAPVLSSKNAPHKAALADQVVHTEVSPPTVPAQSKKEQIVMMPKPSKDISSAAPEDDTRSKKEDPLIQHVLPSVSQCTAETQVVPLSKRLGSTDRSTLGAEGGRGVGSEWSQAAE